MLIIIIKQLFIIKIIIIVINFIINNSQLPKKNVVSLFDFNIEVFRRLDRSRLNKQFHFLRLKARFFFQAQKMVKYTYTPHYYEAIQEIPSLLKQVWNFVYYNSRYSEIELQRGDIKAR